MYKVLEKYLMERIDRYNKERERDVEMLRNWRDKLNELVNKQVKAKGAKAKLAAEHLTRDASWHVQRLEHDVERMDAVTNELNQILTAIRQDDGVTVYP